MYDSIKKFDKELISERLLLRRLNSSDNLDMYEYTSNPMVTEFLSWCAHTTIEQANDFIKQTIIDYDHNDKRYTWGIELKDKRKLIGVISIFDISFLSKRVELSYILNPNFQGMGYMHEALNRLIKYILEDIEFIRVQARCSTENISSMKLLDRIGMDLEGTLKKYWFMKGNYHDVLLYAKTRNDER